MINTPVVAHRLPINSSSTETSRHSEETRDHRRRIGGKSSAAVPKGNPTSGHRWPDEKHHLAIASAIVICPCALMVISVAPFSPLVED